MKKCFQATKQIRTSKLNRRRSSAGRFITSSAGAVTSLILLVALSFISSTLLTITGLTGANTYAEGPSISLSVSSDNLSLNLTPTSADGSFASSDNLNIGVTLSGAGGYTLAIRSSNTSNPTALINGNNTMESITEAVSASDFESLTTYNNQWGYKPSMINSVTNTNYLPAPSLEGSIIEKTSGTDDEGNYTISLGARVDMNTVPGDYSNTFIIAAVANNTCNPNATGILEAVCMQDMNDNVANSMVVHKQYELVDNRDNTVYYVAKMNDGRVWMTQNLDLSLETTPSQVAALTSDNTDLNTYGSQSYTSENGYTCSNEDASCSGGVITWTPARATTTGTASSDWDSTYNNIRSFDYGSYYYYTDASGNDTVYTSKEDCEEAHDDGTCAHYHAGNYYNFNATIASNDASGVTYGTAANSVCPKGWRLPNLHLSYSEVNLTWLAEGITTSLTNAREHGNYTLNGFTKLSNKPLYLARTGLKNSASNPDKMGEGYYYTGAINSGLYGYNYIFNSNYPYPDNADFATWIPRYYGLSIRCIARQSNTGGTTTITFNANGGTGTIASQTINANGHALLTANTFTRQGYVFAGWNTASDGTGVAYDDSAEYYAAVGTLPVNVTLYAQWTPAHTLTLSSDTDISAQVSTDKGSTWVSAPTTVTVGEGTTILLKATDDVEGTVFNGWTKTVGVGDFTTTVWRNNNTKTTTFIVGAGDVTINANGTTTYTTIGSTIVNMQDITACPDWLATGTMYQVTDIRDNDTYSVAKLADGKCWMLENLRLGSNDNTIDLTPSDTNIVSSWTLPKGITNSFSSYTAKQINAAYKNDVAPTKYGDASGKVGTYYNYCAASAGEVCITNDNTTNIEHDICPAGWRMPTGGPVDGPSGLGEYYLLYKSYNENQANFKIAFSVPLSGGFITSSQFNLGSGGFFWASAFAGGLNSYALDVRTDTMNTVSTSSHYYGESIRCLLSD